MLILRVDMLLSEYTDLPTQHALLILGTFFLMWFFQFICLSNVNPRNLVILFIEFF